MKQNISKQEVFESLPVRKALFIMGVPTIISQLVNLIYNMVDAFFIGRTGNSYMMAATTITLTLTMMNVAFSNLHGIGGGSLVARLMGEQNPEEARRVSAFSIYGCLLLSVTYSLLIGIFMNPVLKFLGASDATIGFTRQYTIFVIVIGTLPSILSQTLAHLLRNAGYASEASIGLSGGGILNIFLDPLFMFVILPNGQEVTGAALATLISNVCACLYLLYSYRKASAVSPLSLAPVKALETDRRQIRSLYAVGVPSAILTGLFDVASMCVNILASAHSDIILAGMGIVMKVERIPNAINVGLCQGMMPIVAYNYASGNHDRMKKTIRTARYSGLMIAAICILLLELSAYPVTRVFLSTGAGENETALMTVTYAALFLRIRCLASPFQFLNYHTSFCMQAMGKGKATMLHATVRELGIYIPCMIILDRIFGETGLAAALPVGEACASVFALLLLRYVMNRNRRTAAS